MVSPKIEEYKGKQKSITTEVTELLKSVFRNGNELTIRLIKNGLIRKESPEVPEVPFTNEEKRAFKEGRRLNTKEENALLDSAINEMRSSNSETYSKYGFNFKNVEGVWIQDSVEIIGDFSAKPGTVVMGNLKLINVSISSMTDQLGNAYEPKRIKQKLTLQGKIY
ncbi:MAG: hypothetical protein ACP5M9_03540 [Candidatus Micrarchaeia archaeon]